MTHLFLALLRRLVKFFNNFIQNLETKLKNMKTELTTDVQGLKKFATLKNLSIDADGNYTVNADVHYEDAAGNKLQYTEQSRSVISISGKTPDASIPLETLTPAQKADKENTDAIISAINPVLGNLLSNIS